MYLNNVNSMQLNQASQQIIGNVYQNLVTMENRMEYSTTSRSETQEINAKGHLLLPSLRVKFELDCDGTHHHCSRAVAGWAGNLLRGAYLYSSTTPPRSFASRTDDDDEA